MGERAYIQHSIDIDILIEASLLNGLRRVNALGIDAGGGDHVNYNRAIDESDAMVS